MTPDKIAARDARRLATYERLAVDPAASVSEKKQALEHIARLKKRNIGGQPPPPKPRQPEPAYYYDDDDWRRMSPEERRERRREAIRAAAKASAHVHLRDSIADLAETWKLAHERKVWPDLIDAGGRMAAAYRHAWRFTSRSERPSIAVEAYEAATARLFDRPESLAVARKEWIEALRELRASAWMILDDG